MKKKVKLILLLSTIILSIFGIIMITSASYIWAEYKFNDPFKFMKNQTFFFLVGLIFMYITSKINYKLYYVYSSKLFGLVFFLLILVLIPGIGMVRNGSRSWFGIGSFGIQPSEFMKIAIIIFISKYISKNRKELKLIFKGLVPILIVIFLVFGIIMLQPDFGTGIIIVVISVGLIFAGGANIKFFLGLGLLGISGIVTLILIAPYRLKRITSYLNPWSDPLGSGFQIIQSLYAIGPSGLLGYGFGNSRQKHFYIPEPQTDFIFAIISEEFGFLGTIIVVSLFITIIASCLYISKKCDDLFGKFLSLGIGFWIGFQAILNLMVVVGLIPVTGVTLPFLSYGGSSLLILLIAIGIVLNISSDIK